jgi:hypothetical protein
LLLQLELQLVHHEPHLGLTLLVPLSLILHLAQVLLDNLELS